MRYSFYAAFKAIIFDLNGNATEKLRKSADFVAPSIDEDGLAVYFAKILEILGSARMTEKFEVLRLV